MKLEIHLNIHDDISHEIIINKLSNIEGKVSSMPSIQDVKDAVAAKASEVIAAVKAAVAKETQEVIAQIQAIPVGQSITQADLDGIVASVSGIGTAATEAVDTISVNDVPAPPPPPPLP